MINLKFPLFPIISVLLLISAGCIQGTPPECSSMIDEEKRKECCALLDDAELEKQCLEATAPTPSTESTPSAAPTASETPTATLTSAPTSTPSEIPTVTTTPTTTPTATPQISDETLLEALKRTNAIMVSFCAFGENMLIQDGVENSYEENKCIQFFEGDSHLSWVGDSFSASFSTNEEREEGDPISYNQSLEGTISSDGKKVETLTAVRESDDGNNKITRRLTIVNMPINQMNYLHVEEDHSRVKIETKITGEEAETMVTEAYYKRISTIDGTTSSDQWFNTIEWQNPEDPAVLTVRFSTLVR